MIGIIALFIMVLWGVFIYHILKFVGKKIPPSLWKIPIGCVLFVAFFISPLWDEILASKEFESLCARESIVQINEKTAAGRSIYYDRQSNYDLENTWVPIRAKPHRYVDATTGEFVVSVTVLVAKGGVLARKIGLAGGAPLAFHGACYRKESLNDMFRRLNITVLDRPEPTEKGE